MNEPNGTPEFKVVISKSLRQLLAHLHGIAFARGMGSQFVQSLRTIDEGLRRVPISFGDPLFRLPALKLSVYIRAVFPIVVDSGVHEQFPLVIVRGFRLMLQD
ncbi:MAG: hypothetical protein FJ271_26430 [Planctomycetes bacterium]|nr:hypothetical protein [Planctomycetota bacterium]